MALLHSDYLKPGDYEWTEYTIRALSLPGQPLGQSIHEDVIRRIPLGRAGRCKHCAMVTIEMKRTAHWRYPWGQDRYGNKRHPDKMTYCPHCDGAEDVE